MEYIRIDLQCAVCGAVLSQHVPVTDQEMVAVPLCEACLHLMCNEAYDEGYQDALEMSGN